MADDKSYIEFIRTFLIKQRLQYFDDEANPPEVERREGQNGLRALTDRRSSVVPNKSDHSRRVNFRDRRATRYGRRNTDNWNYRKRPKPEDA